MTGAHQWTGNRDGRQRMDQALHAGIEPRPLNAVENDVAPAATDTGVRPGVLLTPPPAVLTHVTPQVTSKLFAGLVVDAPTIRITTLILLDNGLATVAVQL